MQTLQCCRNTDFREMGVGARPWAAVMAAQPPCAGPNLGWIGFKNPQRVEGHSREHENKYILSWDSSLPRAGVSLEARGLSAAVGQGWRGWVGHGLEGPWGSGKEEPESLLETRPGCVCELHAVLAVAFRTRDNWNNMTGAEPHAFGDMWLRFWDCLSLLISGKQEDKRWSVKRNEDSDVTEESTWGQDRHLSATTSGLPPTREWPGAVRVRRASCQSGRRASRAFASWGRDAGTAPRVCRKGAGGAAGWRGRGGITGKLETIRGNSQKTQH